MLYSMTHICSTFMFHTSDLKLHLSVNNLTCCNATQQTNLTDHDSGLAILRGCHCEGLPFQRAVKNLF